MCCRNTSKHRSQTVCHNQKASQVECNKETTFCTTASRIRAKPPPNVCQRTSCLTGLTPSRSQKIPFQGKDVTSSSKLSHQAKGGAKQTETDLTYIPHTYSTCTTLHCTDKHKLNTSTMKTFNKHVFHCISYPFHRKHIAIHPTSITPLITC